MTVLDIFDVNKVKPIIMASFIPERSTWRKQDLKESFSK
jgi:hypothetical protein